MKREQESFSVLRQAAQDIYQVRAVLEGLAASLYAERATAQGIAALRASMQALEKVYQQQWTF